MQGNEPLHVEGDEVVGRVRREGRFGSLFFRAGRLGGLGRVPVLERQTIRVKNHGVKRERDREGSAGWP